MRRERSRRLAECERPELRVEALQKEQVEVVRASDGEVFSAYQEKPPWAEPRLAGDYISPLVWE